ncbi:ChaB family protein [Oculatella sp. LEGE 06141]|uniref:ChaB family protein n=1 Tax=Oculatella sp. LEGE 06141 TaxID=1828648 RepID=UPI00187DF6B7|nr:ChaB family protein [Oculatella sp. LEGE 06141]MBE9177571.1 ChaB family protein [Oculatella sp. LEGE 06141]
MPYQNLDELPQDVKEKMPQGAQQAFVAAFNAAESDGMSKDAATQVAWNSVKQEYNQDKDGTWYHREDRKSESSPLGNVGSSGT